MTFSPDGTLIASSGFENDVLIWDWQTQNVPSTILTGHTVSVFSLAFSEDMSTLFVAEGDGVIRIWDVKTWLPRCKITAGHPINYIAILRNGRENSVRRFRGCPPGVACRKRRGSVRIWMVPTIAAEVSLVLMSLGPKVGSTAASLRNSW